MTSKRAVRNLFKCVDRGKEGFLTQANLQWMYDPQMYRMEQMCLQVTTFDEIKDQLYDNVS